MGKYLLSIEDTLKMQCKKKGRRENEVAEQYGIGGMNGMLKCEESTNRAESKRTSRFVIVSRQRPD